MDALRPHTFLRMGKSGACALQAVAGSRLPAAGGGERKVLLESEAPLAPKAPVLVEVEKEELAFVNGKGVGGLKRSFDPVAWREMPPALREGWLDALAQERLQRGAAEW